MLTLVSNNNITFKSGNSSNVWTAVIPKGNSYKFNKTVRGPSTRQYLDPIKELTNENFTLIVEETQKYVKKPSQTYSSMDSDEEDSEYEDLFTFHWRWVLLAGFFLLLTLASSQYSPLPVWSQTWYPCACSQQMLSIALCRTLAT